MQGVEPSSGILEEFYYMACKRSIHLFLLVDGAEDDLGEPLLLEHPEGDSSDRPPLLVHQRQRLVPQVENQPLDVALKLIN